MPLLMAIELVLMAILTAKPIQITALSFLVTHLVQKMYLAMVKAVFIWVLSI